MPRIPQNVLDSTIYLYPTLEAAERGESCGGTGFLVGPSPTVGWCGPHVYAVTNYHVAVKGGGNPVVRINTHDGKPEIFDFDPSEWHFVPNADDVAVIRLPVRSDLHRIRVLDFHTFISKQDIARERLGAGDDVFMVGRFINHDGGRTNVPALRFGHISVMPAPIFVEELRRTRVYYCVDLHSRPGYSGSPVFVYRTFGSDLSSRDVNYVIKALRKGEITWLGDLKPFFGLLGIHAGQFQEPWAIKDRKKDSLKKSTKYVEGLSGMAMVIPAWAIEEALNLPAVKKEREQIDSQSEMGKRIQAAQNTLRLEASFPSPHSHPKGPNRRPPKSKPHKRLKTKDT